MRRFLPVLVLSLVASVISVLPASGQQIDDALRPPEDLIDFEAEEIPEEPVVGIDGNVRAVPIEEPPVEPAPKSGEETRSGWKPGRDSAAVAAGRDVGVGESPVTVKLNRGNGNGRFAADMRVNVLDEPLADQLSPFGAAVSVDFAEARGNGRVRPDGSYEIAFDLSDVNLGSPSVYDRLSVTRFDGCDVFEPENDRNGNDFGEVACESAVELEATFEVKGRRLVVIVDEAEVAGRVTARREALTKSGVSAIDLDATRGRKPASDEKRVTMLPDAESRLAEAAGAQARGFAALGTAPSTYAITSGAASSSGNFASPVVPVLTEANVGLATGAAETSYPVPLPTAAAGPTPSVSLVYSSASIDGLTLHTNTQSGAAGVGWSLAAGGSIVRRLQPCNVAWAPGDLCLSGEPNGAYAVNLAGRASALVLVDASDPNDLEFRMESDPFWRIRLHTGGSVNGATVSTPDHLNQWWSVETTDGTVYTLGTQAQSTDWLPVYFESGGCSETYALCDTARQWNVDTVTDVFGNQMTYEWDQEFNWYNARGITPTYKRQYVRASNLASIEYGANPGLSAPANARVEFSYEWRCGSGNDFGDCRSEQMPTPTDQAWPAAFLDTPTDLWCGPYETGGLYQTVCTQQAPTFWSQLRLTGILAQVKDGTGWATVGNHDVLTEFTRDESVHTDSDPNNDLDSDFVTVLRTLYDRNTDRSVIAGQDGSYRWHGFDPLHAEDADEIQGVTIGDIHDIGADQGAIGLSSANYIKFDDVWLGWSGGSSTDAIIRMSAWNAGTVQVWIDGPNAGNGGTLLGSIDVTPHINPNQYLFRTFELDNFGSEHGIHDIYIVGSGNTNDFANVSFIRFGRDDYSPLPELSYVDFGIPESSEDPGYKFLENRLNHPAGTSAMLFPRIKKITNQLGGVIRFNYGQDNACTAASFSANPALPPTGSWHLNSWDCFPQYDTSTSQPGFTIFNKWTVQTMTREAGGTYSPPVVTTYDYDDPFWGFNDNPDSVNDTWNSFRAYNIVSVSDATSVTNAGKTEYRFFQGSNDEHVPNGATAYPGTVQNSSGNNLDDDYALRGRVYEMRTMTLAGTELNKERTTFAVTPTVVVNGDRNDPTFAGPQTVESWVDSSSTTTSLTYGPWGEPLSVNEQGGSANSDNRTTVTRYYDPTTAATLGAWRGPQPCVIAIRSGDSTAAPSANNAINFDRYTQLFYDNETARTCDREVDEPVVTNRDVANDDAGRLDYESEIDDRGRVFRTKMPNEEATTLTFDPIHGQVTETTNPLLWKTTLTYDQFRRPHISTDVNGRATETLYDQFNRVVTVIAPGDETTNPTVKVTYNNNQTPAWVQTETRLHDTDYTKSVEFFDGFGRNVLNRTLSPVTGRNYATAVQYDNAGRMHRSSATFTIFNDNVTTFDYPNWGSTPAQTETVYDAAGRVLESRTNKGVSGTISTIYKTRYEYFGFTTRFYDGNNQRTDTTVDGLGRTTEVKEVAAGNLTTSYEYNAANDLTTLTGPDGAVTTITYDTAGRKLTLDDPDTGTGPNRWVYTYNVNSMLKTQKDPSGTTITFAYDELDRMINRKNGSTLLADWLFDTNDRGKVYRTRSYNGSSGIVYQYNILDNLGRTDRLYTYVPVPSGSGRYRFNTKFTYRDDHQIKTIRNPNGLNLELGETVTYDYNDRTGQAVDLQAGSDKIVDNITWNNAGQIFQRQYGTAAVNGTATFLFDAYTLRLYENRAGSSTSSHAYQRLQYHYDNNSNITRIRAYRNLNQRQCYTYDALDRMTKGYTDSVNCNGYTPKGSGNFNENYTYTNGGNLLTRTGNGFYTYGDPDHKHAVTAMSDGSTFAYDDNGNMTDRDLVGQPDQTLSWNVDQRLESLAIAGGATTNFIYDADGNRVRRTTGGNSVYYSAGGSEYERESGVGTFTHYYRIGGNTVAYRSGTTLTWLWSDHLNSSTVTKTAGGPVVKQRYTPWGELRTNGNLTTDRHYTGQTTDLETGLAFYNARYYDPAVGRFISPDTIIPNPGNGQDLNRYTYVLNNPIGYNDPSGNCTQFSDWGDGAYTCDFYVGGSIRGAGTLAGNVRVEGDGIVPTSYEGGGPGCLERQSNALQAGVCGTLVSVAGLFGTLADPVGTVRSLAEVEQSCNYDLAICLGFLYGQGTYGDYQDLGAAYVAGGIVPDLIELLYGSRGAAGIVDNLIGPPLPQRAYDAPLNRGDLGFDPATQRFRRSEYDTALRVEATRGVRLRRDPTGRTEWIDQQGRTYDAVGGFDGEYFDRQWANLQNRIVDHRQKATFVPVDVSGFSNSQVQTVTEFVESLNDPNIFVVGG